MGQNGELIGMEFLLVRGVWNVLKLDCDDGCTPGEHVKKKHWILPFKWTNCMICELYIKKLVKTSLKYFYSSPGLGIIVADWGTEINTG